jgi:hypothetical protein
LRDSPSSLTAQPPATRIIFACAREACSSHSSATSQAAPPGGERGDDELLEVHGHDRFQ